jgi:hypothetical protein
MNMASVATPAAIHNDESRLTREDSSRIELSNEIEGLITDCSEKYRFNSRWDNVLNIFGIGLSLGIVSAGVFRYPAIAAILGGMVAALVSAQRAFPFGQRAIFYRNLVGQAKNLRTEFQQSLIPAKDAVAILKALRLDFAQQLPRGITSVLDRSAEQLQC